MSRRHACSGIKTFAGQAGTLVDLVGRVHDAGEGIGEVETEQTTNEVGEGAELRNGHSDDEGEDPVERTHAPPEVFPLLTGDWGPAENFLPDFDVNSLHADIEVED